MDFSGSKISFVVVKHPMGGIGKESVAAKAKAAFPEILEAATKWAPTAVDESALKQAPSYPAPTFTFKGTSAELNQMFIDKGWSNGIPIIPPTPEKVATMLKGTTRQPDEVVWIVPPRKGVVTVELVATYAVMAGCKPAYMPVILSALDAMKDQAFNWQALTTTTHPNAPLIMVNGPIAKEIGLASGRGAMGGGYQANTSIGYAIALITDVVGDSRPQTNDNTAQGWAGNAIATVVAENIDESPWKPFSIDKGFGPEDSTVTVFSGGPPLNIADHTSKTIDGVLRAFADTVTYAGQNTACGVDRDVILVINPEFANLFNDAGFTKEKLQVWLWENARKPAGAYPDLCGVNAAKTLGIPVDDSTPVPTVSKPEHYKIFVAGGQGKHSQYWPGFTLFNNPNSQAQTVVTVKVQK
ncbi:MAG: hypothetical protein P4N41_12970 [Negativicutes bacterium]|nr:hypothetical protein [Negativicutes bacterium]